MDLFKELREGLRPQQIKTEAQIRALAENFLQTVISKENKYFETYVLLYMAGYCSGRLDHDKKENEKP